MLRRNEFSTVYKEEKNALLAKKEVAWTAKDMKKWDLDHDNLPVATVKLLEDKKLAQRYMFPKVDTLDSRKQTTCAT